MEHNMNKFEIESKQAERLKFHPITLEYCDMEPGEYAALREDIRVNGQRVPAIIWNGQVIDGRHRAKVCAELGLKLITQDWKFATEEEVKAFVASLNQHRRSRTAPLSSEEKRARAKAELQADPARSDVAIAERIGASDKTVGKVRAELEKGSEIRTPPPAERKSRTGTKGQGARHTTGRRATPAPTSPSPASAKVASPETSPADPAANPELAGSAAPQAPKEPAAETKPEPQRGRHAAPEAGTADLVSVFAKLLALRDAVAIMARQPCQDSPVQRCVGPAAPVRQR
jgi:hypothetical protein